MRRQDGPVHGGLAAGRDEDLDGLEQLRRPQLAVPLLHLLVARELVDRLVLPPVAERRALALDDSERDAVDEQHHVGADVLLRPVDLELPGDDELVAGRVVEVEEPDRVALLPLPSPISCSSAMP